MDGCNRSFSLGLQKNIKVAKPQDILPEKHDLSVIFWWRFEKTWTSRYTNRNLAFLLFL